MCVPQSGVQMLKLNWSGVCGMLFPANLVLLGASTVAVVALIASGRLLIATAHEMGNPKLCQKARAFMGYWALAVTVAMLSVGTTVTLLAHRDTMRPSAESLAQAGTGSEVIPPDKSP